MFSTINALDTRDVRLVILRGKAGTSNTLSSPAEFEALFYHSAHVERSDVLPERTFRAGLPFGKLTSLRYFLKSIFLIFLKNTQ